MVFVHSVPLDEVKFSLSVVNNKIELKEIIVEMRVSSVFEHGNTC